jgi:thiol-disulfide isomerase/thioredoxin
MPNFKTTLRMIATLVIIGAAMLLFYSSQFDTLPKGAKPQFPAKMQLLNGQVLEATALPRKPLVVNFWATWCPPCRQELPQFAQVSRRYADTVLFLGIAVDSPISELNRFQSDFQISYPIVLGTNEMLRAWKAETLPTTYFLNTAGEVVRAHRGALSEQELIDTLESILHP